MNLTCMTNEKHHSFENQPYQLDIRNIQMNESLFEQYAEIYQQHEINRKWILMINPEDYSLEQLSKANKIDPSKILKVNTNKKRINLNNIESVLCNGNCSAVILCNPCLEREELKLLKQYARKGKTACIVLTNAQHLH